MHFTVFNINMTEEGTITNPIIIDSDDNDIISITFSDSELEENVGGVEEPYVTWTDEEDTVIWEMDFCQCSQHEPDGEEDVVKPNVICPEEEDTILLGSSIESAEENMLLGKQLLLLLVLKYCNFLQYNYIYFILYCVSTNYLYPRPKLVHFLVKGLHSLVNLN
jgi:hypothetical protein